MRLFCVVLVAATISVPAYSAVVTASPQEFVVKHNVQVNRSPGDAYKAFTAQIASWWDAEHSYSGQASNFSLEARGNGCFCEKLASGGSVAHMTVIFADPGKTLRMQGGLGPLQSMAVNGVMTVTFATIPSGTRIEITYAVGGQPSHALDKLAPVVDQVLIGQWERFARFANTGKP